MTQAIIAGAVPRLRMTGEDGLLIGDDVLAKMVELARKYETAGPGSIRCMLREAISASQRMVIRPPHHDDIDAARFFFSGIASDGLPAGIQGKWLSGLEEGLLTVLEREAKGVPL